MIVGIIGEEFLYSHEEKWLSKFFIELDSRFKSKNVSIITGNNVGVERLALSYFTNYHRTVVTCETSAITADLTFISNTDFIGNYCDTLIVCKTENGRNNRLKKSIESCSKVLTVDLVTGIETWKLQ